MVPGRSRPRVVVICGPTALGKTTAAIELAEIFDGEIVGADSMQIYKHMDIGTAKPTQKETARVKHHMIDIIDPDERFDARQYAALARETIEMLYHRNKLPFVVGGTGFYIKALLNGLFETESTEEHIRKGLKKEADSYGIAVLYARLCRLDPDAANKIHPNDKYRVVRALEVHARTGKPLSAYHKAHGFKDHPFVVIKIGLHIRREMLYDRINKRVDAMIGSGLLDEVKGLLAMGCSPESKSMQSIGYRHMVDFIKGDSSWEETVRTLKRDTRRYAKRQMTWFGADPEIIWKAPDEMQDIKTLINKFLQNE
ncbi:MAG: tRNA (adenosine(37)-N6)-dimethylallyltransferase MiaA [Desulfobacterales bacterium]